MQHQHPDTIRATERIDWILREAENAGRIAKARGHCLYARIDNVIGGEDQDDNVIVLVVRGGKAREAFPAIQGLCELL